MAFPPTRVPALVSFLTLFTGPVALAQSCVLQESFEGVDLPAGWDGGPQVEQQDANGNGLGTFTDAWTIGTSAEASLGGYFQVPDTPPDNRFAMANDDAPPCNCDLSSIALTTPAVDLTGVNNSLLDLRYLLDGAFGADSAWVEVSTNNVDWTWLELLPVSGATWSWHSVDLSDYDGQSAFQLRFRWTDNGDWATGFAIDEVCVRGAVDHDLSLEQGFIGDPQASAFDPSVFSLGYAQVPLEQFHALLVAGALRNRGKVPLFNVFLRADVSLNGVLQGQWESDTIPVLTPGARDTMVIQTDWVPNAFGNVEVNFLASSGGSEDLPGDETAQSGLQVTGPSWAEGDGAMGLCNSPTEGGIDRFGRPYQAGCRYELLAEDEVFGLTVRLGDGTYPGARIVGLLLDDDLQLISSTDTLVVTTFHIADGLSGGWTFLTFPTQVGLDSGDVWAMLEQLPDSGQAVLATGCTATTGSSLLFDADTQLWSYPSRAPLVRMHLSPVAVGWSHELVENDPPLLFPNPADASLTISRPTAIDHLDVRTADGRLFRSFIGNGTSRRLDVSAWPEGLYMIECTSSAGRATGRLVVVHGGNPGISR